MESPLGSWQPFTHGNPGWKFWAFIIAFLFLVWLAVKLFYGP
jgi:hypothetical protein